MLAHPERALLAVLEVSCFALVAPYICRIWVVDPHTEQNADFLQLLFHARRTYLLSFLGCWVPGLLAAAALRRRSDWGRGRVDTQLVLLTLRTHLLIWLLGSGLLFAVCVLLGSPLFEDLSSTLVFSLVASSLSFLPAALMLPLAAPSFRPVAEAVFLDVFLLKSVKASSLTSVYCVFGALLGAWLGAVPIPLDWERPWQVWPISCVLGLLIVQPLLLLVSSVLGVDRLVLDACRADKTDDADE